MKFRKFALAIFGLFTAALSSSSAFSGETVVPTRGVLELRRADLQVQRQEPAKGEFVYRVTKDNRLATFFNMMRPNHRFDLRKDSEWTLSWIDSSGDAENKSFGRFREVSFYDFSVAFDSTDLEHKGGGVYWLRMPVFIKATFQEKSDKRVKSTQNVVGRVIAIVNRPLKTFQLKEFKWKFREDRDGKPRYGFSKDEIFSQLGLSGSVNRSIEIFGDYLKKYLDDEIRETGREARNKQLNIQNFFRTESIDVMRDEGIRIPDNFLGDEEEVVEEDAPALRIDII